MISSYGDLYIGNDSSFADLATSHMAVDNTPVQSDVSVQPQHHQQQQTQQQQQQQQGVCVSGSAACCSLPQCDTCLGLLHSQQNSLVAQSTSLINCVRSQLDSASHAGVNKIASAFTTPSPPNSCSVAVTGTPSAVTAAANTVMPSGLHSVDAQRKISVMSNQSTMSTDSDYVSDTNNLYFDGHMRKFSDTNCYEPPNSAESYHNFAKPASCSLTLNLSAASTTTTSWARCSKDQSCQTPVAYPPDCVDFKNEVKLSDIQRQASVGGESNSSFDDPKRKISNISTISTLSSLSTESTSTFDTITLGTDNASQDEFYIDMNTKYMENTIKVAQVSRTSICTAAIGTKGF